VKGDAAVEVDHPPAADPPRCGAELLAYVVAVAPSLVDRDLLACLVAAVLQPHDQRQQRQRSDSENVGHAVQAGPSAGEVEGSPAEEHGGVAEGSH
jgi:hypothetical protein